MTSKVTFHTLMVGVVTMALMATPACAKIDDHQTKNTLNAEAPSTDGDNLSGIDNSADNFDAASLRPKSAFPAPSPFSTTNDSLANFGAPSGTVVSKRAQELREAILHLRASVNANTNEFNAQRATGAGGSVQYHSTVAAISARLQNGTTRGNPILLRQWEEANNSLNEVTNSLNRLNNLRTAVDADSATATYLLESVQAAFQLSGAVDEDHDQLKLLRDEVSRLAVQIDYLHNQTTGDIERQTNYLSTERANLQVLAAGISRGELVASTPNPQVIETTQLPSVTPEAYGSSGKINSAPVSRVDYAPDSPDAVDGAGSSQETAATPTVGHLLVLIRFNQSHVDYEKQLTAAINNAVSRRPNAKFSVVAVTPATGNPDDLASQHEEAMSDAEDVKGSLINMGISASHISVASTQIQSAQTPEVHIYIH